MTDSGSSGRVSLTEFTVFDWIGTIGTGWFALKLIAFAVLGDQLRAQWREFGGEMPLLTQWVSGTWFPGLLCLLSVAVLLAAFRRNLTIGQRRAWIVASFVASSGFAALCLVGTFLPIFEMASALNAR